MTSALDIGIVAVAGTVGHYPNLASLAQGLCRDGDVEEQPDRSPNRQTLQERTLALVEASLSSDTLAAARIGVVVCADTKPAATALQISRSLSRGPAVDFPTHGLAEALQKASAWLIHGDVDVAVVAVEEAGDAGVLMLTPMASVRSADVWAVLRSVRRGSATQAEDVCRRAWTDAGVEPVEVGYLELAAWPPDPGVVAAYADAEGCPSCAVGSLAASRPPSAIGALMRTLVALHRRVIPALDLSRVHGAGTPPRQWMATPFYTAQASRPWVANGAVTSRYAAVFIGGERADEVAHILLEEAQGHRRSLLTEPRAVDDVGYLLPLAGEREADLVAALERLQDDVEGGIPLQTLARDLFHRYQARAGARYALALVVHDTEELRREITHALKGVRRAFDQNRDWQTPRGSALTSHPLGEDGIAFVYPGAFNSYPGLGRELFYHFPFLHDEMRNLVSDVEVATAAPYLYPRPRWSDANSEAVVDAEALQANPAAMMASGTTFAVAYTMVLREVFGVEPSAALGYSLGEMTMLWASGVWADGEHGIRSLYASELFEDRLVGPKKAVREYWDVAPANDDFWRTYLLKASVEAVRPLVDAEARVYLTIVNLPDEVVIAGEGAGCRRVIDTLDCHALPVSSDAVIHNETMESELDRFIELYSHPVVGRPQTTFYSADTYAPLELDSRALAEAMARMTCHPVDFPRLVRRAYDDGARVFVELGPLGTCTRWIQRILGDAPHTTVAIDSAKGHDFDGVLRVLARLITHRVPVDLAVLYEEAMVYPLVELSLPAAMPEVAEPALQAQSKRMENADAAPMSPPTAPTPVVASEPLPHALTAPNPVEFYSHYLLPHAARAAQAHQSFLQTRLAAQAQVQSLIELQIAVGRQIVGVLPDTAPSSGAMMAPTPSGSSETSSLAGGSAAAAPPAFDQAALQAFAAGDPEACFGPDFAVYRGRRLSRIPNGDLLLMSRVLQVDGTPGVLEGAPSLVSLYDVPSDAWFYRDSTVAHLPPYAVLMEIAMQPCGFLSAYLRSSLLMLDADLYFRNLDGHGRVLATPDLRGKTVRNRVEMISSTRGQGTIIQAFNYTLSCEGEPFYEGGALFGYFTASALAASAGLDQGQTVVPWLESEGPSTMTARPVPLTQGPSQLRFLRDLVALPEAGRHERGHLYGHVAVSPTDWFFRAHFYQDPVMPGSLGVQAVLQAIESYGRWRYPAWSAAAAVQVPGATTTWRYRGQVTRSDRELTVEVDLTDVRQHGRDLILVGNASVWRRDLRIYEIKGAAVRLNHEKSINMNRR